MLDNKDACRLLNKIQDIYEYQESRQLEEVEMQDAINYYDNDENQFLTSMDESNKALQKEKPSNNGQTINWQGGSTPTGNANKKDAFAFTILCTAANTYTVYGQMVTFG